MNYTIILILIKISVQLLTSTNSSLRIGPPGITALTNGSAHANTLLEVPLKQQKSPKKRHNYLQQSFMTHSDQLRKKKTRSFKKKCLAYSLKLRFLKCSLFESKTKKCLNWNFEYHKTKCSLKREVKISIDKWSDAKTQGIKQSLGLLYKKPVCKRGYILKSFKLANYIKLRCQKVHYNKKFHKFQFQWKDSETSRNGRRLLGLVQDTPACPENDFNLKIYEGEEWSRFRCLKELKNGNKKFSTWKEPVFESLPKKQLKLFGFKNKVDGLPHCPKGWILRDFDMGDWIKIKCFKKEIQKKRVCTKHKVLTRRIYPQYSSKQDVKSLRNTLNVVRRKHRVARLAKKGNAQKSQTGEVEHNLVRKLPIYECLSRKTSNYMHPIKKCLRRANLKKFNPKKVYKKFKIPKCQKYTLLRSAEICISIRMFKGRQQCIKWVSAMPKTKCLNILKVRISKKKTKKICLKYKVLKPRAFCSQYSLISEKTKTQSRREYCSSRVVYWDLREKEIYCKNSKFDKNGICKQLTIDGDKIELSEDQVMEAQKAASNKNLSLNKQNIKEKLQKMNQLTKAIETIKQMLSISNGQKKVVGDKKKKKKRNPRVRIAKE